MHESICVKTHQCASWLSAVFVILVWGVTFASTRALLLDFSPIEIQLGRFSLAWFVLTVCELAQRERLHRAYTWRDEVLFAAMGFSGVAFYQLMENCAIYYTSASNVAILVSFGPIVTALLARMLSSDRSLSPRLVCGSLIAVGGVALVSLNGMLGLHLHPLGDVMALAAIVSWGLYSVFVGKTNARGYPQITVIRKSFFWSLVFLAPLAIWGASEQGYYAMDGSFSVTLDAEINAERFVRPLNWLNLGFLGVLASAACFVLWNIACKSLGVVRTTIGLYLTPIVGVVFAGLFLDERPTVMSIFGGAAIIAGVAVANLRFRREVK